MNEESYQAILIELSFDMGELKKRICNLEKKVYGYALTQKKGVDKNKLSDMPSRNETQTTRLPNRNKQRNI